MIILLLYFLYLINTGLLATGFFLAFRKKRAYSVLWGGLALYHVLSLLNVSSLQQVFVLSTLLYGQILMLFANFLFLLVLYLLDSILLRNKSIRVSSLNHLRKKYFFKRYFYVMILLIGIALLLRFRQGTAVAFSNWEEERLSSTFVDSASTLLGFIFYPSIWLAIRQRRYLLTLILALLGLAFFQISGSRAMLLTLVCAVYFDLLLSAMSFKKKVMLLATLSVAAFGLHTFTRLVRGLGLALFISIIASGNLLGYLSTYKQIDLSGGESDIYGYYYYVIDKDYNHYPYKSGVTLIRLAMLYIPGRVVSNAKPSDITSQIWLDALLDGLFDSNEHVEARRALIASGDIGSVHPTLWGDAYANAGVFGILLYPVLFSLIFLLVEVCLLRLSSLGLLLIAPIIGVGYLMTARGSVVAGIGYLAYIIPMALLISYLAKFPIFIRYYIRKPIYAPNSYAS